VKFLGPEIRRHGGLKKKTSNNIVHSTNGMLSLTVLLRGVGAGKMENGVVSLKEGVEFNIVKFFTVVTLNS
jgi:hypothetical protein